MNILKSKYKIIILFFSFSIVFTSCVKEPVSPLISSNDTSSKGIYVICEGLWHYDNSALSKINENDGNIIPNYFQLINNYKLGDLANGGIMYKNDLYIVLTTPAIIEKINLLTGKSIGRLKLKPESDPRKIYILNDTTAYITNLMNHSVSVINPRDMIDKNIEITVGPAPENISGDGKYVYVANSGFGDYLYDEPGAGTISVINSANNNEINKIPCGENIIEVKYNKKLNRLYACYFHLPSNKDSVGGIVEYSLPHQKEINRLRSRANAIAFSEDEVDMFYNTDEGIYRINLLNNEFKPELIIKNPNQKEKWYSIAQYGNKIYIGNAKNYQTKGEVIVYSMSNFSQPIAKYEVGLNPNTIIKY